MKIRALRISSYLQRLAACPETQKLVCRRDIEGFSTLCSRLRVPADYVASLKSIVFPPIVNLAWPTEPPSPDDGGS